MAKIGRIEGHTDGLGKGLDTLRTQTENGFRDVRGEMRDGFETLNTTMRHKVADLKSRDSAQNGQIREVKGKILGLERWKWLVVGGSLLSLFVLDKVLANWDLISGLFGG